MQKKTRGMVAAVLLAGLASAAQAHTGQGSLSFMEGLAHPFGLDHMLAMFAVGVWSVSALPASKVWQGPATFLLALMAAATLGQAGVQVPYLEHAIALSVVLFGLMLAAARSAGWPQGLGLGLIVVAASLHGLAHGAEAPATGFSGYAAGFLATTALLHTSGVLAGSWLQRTRAASRRAVLGGMGAAMGGAGVYLLGPFAA